MQLCAKLGGEKILRELRQVEADKLTSGGYLSKKQTMLRQYYVSFESEFHSL